MGNLILAGDSEQDGQAEDTLIILGEANTSLKKHEISATSKLGYKFLKQNRFRDAIGCFERILTVDENNSYALVGMGDAVRKQGEYRKAVGFYLRCLEHYSNNSYALFGLGECYNTLNKPFEAIKAWEEYLKYDNANITVQTRVANSYRKVRDFKNAKTTFLKVLAVEADNAYAIIGLGHLHYEFKDYKEAMGYWEHMVELNPENVDIRVLTSIGNCHRKLKTFSEGVPYFERVLEEEPTNFYATFGIADCYRGLSRQSFAVEYWNRILVQDPRNKLILTRAGDAYRVMGEFDKAQNYYERALDLEFDTYAVLGLALISKGQKKFREATLSLQRLIQLDDKNHRVVTELADCLVQMGDRQTAVETLRNFQRSGVRNPHVAQMLETI